MKMFKLILPPDLYKSARKAAKAEGISLGEFCQRASPVPVEVYVQGPIRLHRPLDRSTGLEA